MILQTFEFNFEWEVVSDGKTLQSGKIPILILNLKQELLFRFRLKIEPAPGAEYFLNIRVSRSDAWNYVPEDHVYATAQFKCL